MQQRLSGFNPSGMDTGTFIRQLTEAANADLCCKITEQPALPHQAPLLGQSDHPCGLAPPHAVPPCKFACSLQIEVSAISDAQDCEPAAHTHSQPHPHLHSPDTLICIAHVSHDPSCCSRGCQPPNSGRPPRVPMFDAQLRQASARAAPYVRSEGPTALQPANGTPVSLLNHSAAAAAALQAASSSVSCSVSFRSNPPTL